MVHIKSYEPTDKATWDGFVRNAKNATFLFLRDYMNYHADRFRDASLMFLNAKGKVIALLPANLKEGRLSSHDGLTYGGLLTDAHITTSVVLEIFEELKRWMRSNGLRGLRYKAIPYIYHTIPADEDLYALTQCFEGVRLAARAVSTAIPLQHPLPWRELRARGVRKALKNGVTVDESEDFVGFWQILDHNLNEKYRRHPVHTLQEILLLKRAFPDHLRLFVAQKDGELLGGILMYESNAQVVHSQYISSTALGRSLGALDAIVHHLVTKVYTRPTFFDFGKSTEGAEEHLNEHLIFQKEGFGGRAVCYDTYEWEDRQE